MNRQPLALAHAFEPASKAEWLAMVEKTLKGASAESLIAAGPDGLTLKPIYEASLAPTDLVLGPRPATRPWDIRARIREPDPAAARDAVLDELTGGASSVIVAIDWGDASGVSVTSAEDLAAALDGVLIDVATIGLDAGFLGVSAADWLSLAAKGSPSSPLAFHLDPLSAFAVSGASPGPIESHLITSANVAVRLASIHPKASLSLASGVVVHEAGGGPAQELAFALAASLAYAKALVRSGLKMERAFSSIVLGLAVDADPLISIAKGRAARLCWSKMTNACGVAEPAKIEVRTSRRMLTRSEPWNNLVRLTAAAFAGAVSGADAICVAPFTDSLGLPTAFARRMARNIQLILMEEGHLGAVSDPSAGSGAFEALSRELAREAWRRFQTIEAAGGVVTALREGTIAQDAAADRAEVVHAFAAREMKLVGVTDFRAESLREAAFVNAPPLTADSSACHLPGPDSHCPALTPVTLEDLAG